MTDMLLGAGFILFLVLAGLAVLLRGRRARPHRGRRRQQATGLGTTAGVFDAAWLAGSDQTGDSGGGHSGDSGGGGCGGGGCGGGV